MNDHIPDVTKMINDTPRTDAEEYESQDGPVAKLGAVDADFARQLERELNAGIDRIKPTPVLRPWTADEVPLGAQVRSKSYHPDHCSMIIQSSYHPDHRSMIIQSGNSMTREGWLTCYEHSTDGGKTWLPCGVMEETK